MDRRWLNLFNGLNGNNDENNEENRVDLTLRLGLRIGQSNNPNPEFTYNPDLMVPQFANLNVNTDRPQEQSVNIGRGNAYYGGINLNANQMTQGGMARSGVQMNHENFRNHLPSIPQSGGLVPYPYGGFQHLPFPTPNVNVNNQCGAHNSAPSMLLAAHENVGSSSNPVGRGRRRAPGEAISYDPEKRCSNVLCNAKNTPMWRRGPQGPRTLCNACGIKYRKEEQRKLAREAASSSSDQN